MHSPFFAHNGHCGWSSLHGGRVGAAGAGAPQPPHAARQFSIMYAELRWHWPMLAQCRQCSLLSWHAGPAGGEAGDGAAVGLGVGGRVVVGVVGGVVGGCVGACVVVGAAVVAGAVEALLVEAALVDAWLVEAAVVGSAVDPVAGAVVDSVDGGSVEGFAVLAEGGSISRHVHRPLSFGCSALGLHVLKHAAQFGVFS